MVCGRLPFGDDNQIKKTQARVLYFNRNISSGKQLFSVSYAPVCTHIHVHTLCQHTKCNCRTYPTVNMFSSTTCMYKHVICSITTHCLYYRFSATTTSNVECQRLREDRYARYKASSLDGSHHG